MPCVGGRDSRPSHRPKNFSSRIFPWNACVARPVNKAELNSHPKAREAVDKEWDRLREKKVWDEDFVREWDDVRAESKRTGKEVHMGYLFAICVEKNSELDVNNPLRKYKGRVVFQGNREPRG